jgi:transposase
MAKTRSKSTRAPSAITPIGGITGGVDTHKDFHVAAAQDSLGRVLGTQKFPATPLGYAELSAWLHDFGPVDTIGVEGTGSYGAGLSVHLTGQHVRVVEVNRPNRQKRRRQGKSDTLDAINAATAVLSGEATATPKPRTGPVESVRVLRETRGHMNKARTAAINTLRSLIITAPAALRESLHDLTGTALIAHCAAFTTPAIPAKGLRGKTRATAHDELATALLDSETAVRLALRDLAATITFHDQRISEIDTSLDTLLRRIAPRTSALFGVGPGRAAQLLLTAGDHPSRVHNEAAFACLTGTAPLDCSSGRQQHHRLSRAGDRQANSVLYYIVLTRMACHEPTRTYIKDRLGAGKKMTKKHLIRCLKRYLTRQIYPHLMADLADLATLQPLDKP